MNNFFDRHASVGWRLGVLAGLAMALLSLIPQAHVWYKRGSGWQGTYAYFYSDEPAYAAYTNALIDGRPRLNDPYTGQDDSPAAPQSESLFSIQFVPPYLIALPARALGLETNTMFILLMPLVAFGASLAIYRLLALITKDARLAAAGVPFTLCLAILISGQGLANSLAGGVPAYVYLPFLRRYVPGVSFVFFFGYGVCLWRALTDHARRTRLLSALTGGLLFASMVYSYFYHWTTAAALAAATAALWLIARPEGWRTRLDSFAVLAFVSLGSLIPYALLLSRRAPTMDTVQALTLSHAPDLWRGVVALAVLVLVALGYGVWRKQPWLDARSPAVIFNAALALAVLIVFNQQIITGRSLQPMHYEQYIGNYIALLAAILAAGLIRQGRAAMQRPTLEQATNATPEQTVEHTTRTVASPTEQLTGLTTRGVAMPTEPTTAHTAGQVSSRPVRGIAPSSSPLIPHRLWLTVALASVLWGAGETIVATRRFAAVNTVRDDWGAVTNRLRTLTDETPRASTDAHPVAFTTSVLRADNLPAATPLGIIWAPHMFVFSGVSVAENKERFFRYLYFSGVAAERFTADYRDRGFIQFAIFGWERANPRLTVNPKPVTPAEIAEEQRNYAAYIAAFNRDDAARFPLAYVIVSDDQPLNYTNLDRWYERDAGERLGAHVIHRVKLRD